MWLFTELKRRNVFRVGAAYLVAGWLLIQVAETIFPLFGFNEGPARVVVVVLAIGFPLVLIFSWLYELTPEGLKLEQDVDRSSSITHHTGKKLDKAIIVVLTIAIAYFAIDKFLLDPIRDSARDQSVAQQTRSDVFLEKFGESSIAVMPFVNMSDDASNEYFSDGISEELLNLLAQIPRLRVISRSTMFQFKGKEIDVRSVAEQLDVSHVLEGSVRKAGNRVRITAQLIEASTDTHLWSSTYDRDLTDIFKIQDEISAEIVNSLQDELQIENASIPVATPSSSIEAYESFLRGRQFVAQRSPDGLKLAVEELENAIELDPDYAIAHAELAIAYELRFEGAFGDLTDDESNQLAEPHAELALSLDPDLAEAHAALGFVRYAQYRHDEATTHFEEAIRLNPSYSNTYNWFALLLAEQGHYAEYHSIFILNVRIDPLYAPARGNLIGSLVRRHNFEEARKHLRSLQRQSSRHYDGWTPFIDLVESGWAAGLFGYLNAYRTTILQSWMGEDIAYLFVVIGLEDEAIAFMDPPNYETLAVAGKSAEAFAVAKANAKANGTEKWDWGMGLALASGGNYVEALPWLQHNWDILGHGKVLMLGRVVQAVDATALIQARSASGSDADVDVILDAMNADVQRLRLAGFIGDGLFKSTDYAAALVSLQSGEREQGFAFLEAAVDQGTYIPTKLEFLRFMYDDPGFAPILAKQKANQARERDKFLSVVCVDNPYADVWVPMESTCSDYAAASVN